MLTKYILEIDGEKHEVPKECLKNWDEIKCTYKRADFSGVTRSFTSQFEFVGRIYDLLLALYLRDGISAGASLTLYTITDNWEWEALFTSDLDFSSISWDNYSLKLNCIDDSLAAAIKARKSTKYEFVVGQDIPVNNTLLFDRVTMNNHCTHEIMGDSWERDGSYVLLRPGEGDRLPAYVVGKGEAYENSPILYSDQSGEYGDAFVEVVSPMKELEIEVEIRTNGGCATGDIIENVYIWLVPFDIASGRPERGEDWKKVFDYNCNTPTTRQYLGLFPSFEALKRRYPAPPENSWALVGNDYETATEAYVSSIGNVSNDWIATTSVRTRNYRGGPIIQRCSLCVYHNKFTFKNVPRGTGFALMYTAVISNSSASDARDRKYLAIQSKITTKWQSKAKSINIDALTPSDVCAALMSKITDGRLNITAEFDDADERFSKTCLFAAESIRNIANAKFYTSFNDFCDWMETVFGYTYFLGPLQKTPFRQAREYAYEITADAQSAVHDTICPNYADEPPVFVKNMGCFAIRGLYNNADGSVNFHTKWGNSKEYNDPATGKARVDTIFYDGTSAGYFVDDNYSLCKFGDYRKALLDSQTISFVHRNKIFSGDEIIRLNNITDFSYTVNTSMAYSAVTIGYEKRDYETECGRDEWNFSIEYTTGIDKVEKSLSLISKYRADCYGFEFLAQKRSKDTTDDSSDNNVFFAYCRTEDIEDEIVGSREDGESETEITTKLYLDRSGCVISGTLTNDVFNGKFSPYYCVVANAAYMAAGNTPMTLKFASHNGNADVCIDGHNGGADIILPERLFSLGEINFTSPDIEMASNANALFEVQTDGKIYRGYISEASMSIANNATAKYKLIVKEIIPC